MFCYERGVLDVARVGRITSVQRSPRELTLTWEFDPAIPPIQPHVLESLYGPLDIDPKYESHRTHWAVKEVNLRQVLIQMGIIAPQAPQAPPPPPPPPPKVFISYSWDSPEHKQWVAQLAGFLRGRGIDVILDRWSVGGGHDLAVFMQESISRADRVLLICTEAYVAKATQRSGGVAYEQMVLNSELMQNVNTHKFIPLVCQTHHPRVLLPQLASRFYFDLSEGPHYAEQLDALVMELHGVRVPIPPLGPRPFG